MKERQVKGHITAAAVYSQLSYCERLKVGCIIVAPDGRQVISIGYNGTPPNEDNVCELPTGRTKPNVIHAEINAIEKLEPGEAEGTYVFCTHSPCPNCAERLINEKIHTLYYSQEYRSLEGINDLKAAGITVIQVEPTIQF